MKLQYGVFLNEKDKFHFLLCAKYLPLSKDLVRYIAKNFFYENIPIVDHYMKPYLKSQEDRDLFEKLKHNPLQRTFAPGDIRDELWFGMMIAFSQSGIMVCLYVHSHVYNDQINLLLKFGGKYCLFRDFVDDILVFNISCSDGFKNKLYISKAEMCRIEEYPDENPSTVLVFVNRREQDENIKLINCTPGLVKMLIKENF
jgi:hypothetical protein